MANPDPAESDDVADVPDGDVREARNMKVHELKVWPEYYDALDKGNKTVELRFDDRAYEVGDVLCLQEWEPASERYTGSVLYRRVTHILRGEPYLAEGYVAMSIRETRSGDLKLEGTNLMWRELES